MGGQRRRRLVEDDQPGVDGQGPGDLDELPLAGREVLDGRVGVAMQVHDLEQFAGPSRGVAGRSIERAAPGEGGDEQVLGDGQVGEQVQLLVDERDPRDGRPRAGSAGA